MLLASGQSYKLNNYKKYFVSNTAYDFNGCLNISIFLSTKVTLLKLL
jgi:hypothetical protein